MNLFEHIPEALPEEWVELLAEGANARVERIVSNGQASPAGFWYDQDEHEWVLLIAGFATLEFEDRRVDLYPGDHLLIPAHEKHRVAATAAGQPTIWLAVFFD